MVNKVTMNNLFSFGSPISFNLVANKKERRHKDHIVKIRGVKTLRGAIVFGPNAVGKTNLIKGLALFEKMFYRNTCKVAAGCQFCLTSRIKDGMSWIIEYSFGGHQFRYSLGTNGREVLSEKLECIDSQECVLFDRFQSRRPLFGAIIKDEPWYQQRYVTTEALFLRKLEQDALRLQPDSLAGKHLIVSALDGLESIHVVGTRALMLPDEFDKLLNIKEYKAFLLKLMQGADLGITGIVWERIPSNRINYLIGVPVAKSSVLNIRFVLNNESFVAIVSQNGKQEAYEFRFKHGESTIRADAESEGTKRLMHLSALLFHLKQEESTWFVDEIDHHMHPFLARLILDGFFADHGVKSQLVVTAHDTNLMTKSLWRNDEVWFMEKRSDGSSNMYSLSQFVPKRCNDYSYGYLKGLYGALPCLGGEMVS